MRNLEPLAGVLDPVEDLRRHPGHCLSPGAGTPAPTIARHPRQPAKRRSRPGPADHLLQLCQIGTQLDQQLPRRPIPRRPAMHCYSLPHASRLAALTARSPARRPAATTPADPRPARLQQDCGRISVNIQRLAGTGNGAGDRPGPSCGHGCPRLTEPRYSRNVVVPASARSQPPARRLRGPRIHAGRAGGPSQRPRPCSGCTQLTAPAGPGSARLPGGLPLTAKSTPRPATTSASTTQSASIRDNLATNLRDIWPPASSAHADQGRSSGTAECPAKAVQTTVSGELAFKWPAHATGSRCRSLPSLRGRCRSPRPDPTDEPRTNDQMARPPSLAIRTLTCYFVVAEAGFEPATSGL